MSPSRESNVHRDAQSPDTSAGSENVLACFIDAIADIAYMKNLDGRYLLVNAANLRFLNKSSNEVIGHDDFALFPIDQAKRIVDQDRAVLAADASLTFEDEFLRDGATVLLQTIKSVCRDSAGNVIGLVGISRDIGERKHLEETLRQRERELALREKRYRSLAHASSQIVWVGNAEGDQMGNVPEWQAFTGQSPQEALGSGWADAVHPDDRELTLQAWQHAIRTGSTFSIEHRLRRSDGIYRNMAVRAVPVLDDSGQIVEWVGTHTDVTDQRLAQQQSRFANQRLQNVLDSITDGLCVLDRDLRYVYFNENGARMCGLRPADIIGTRVGDTFEENKTNLIARSYRQSLQTGQPVHVEEFSISPLNKWFESNCYPSPDGLTVYFRDITERKRTEAALRVSESRFRQLFNSTLMGIAFPDRFGGFKEGNDELLRITGYTRDDLMAGLVRWDIMTPPEYQELDAFHIEEAAIHGSCTPYEKEYIRKDGSRVPILCGYALLEGSKDEYIGFVLDLTRQRAAEAELRDREQRFRLLAESLPELVWVTDPVGSLTYLNSRFLAYCGISSESMLGFDWQTILHPDEADRVNQAWNSSVSNGQPYLVELRLRCHDGTFRHFLARALPTHSAAGEVEYWVGSCTDIHDQKLAEEALRRSEKLAATGRLAASIAHEINNPLESVINSLYLALQDTGLAPRTRAFLQTAEQELARVSQITTQTLRFHRQSKAAAVVDLSEIMRSVLTLFRSRLIGRHIQIFTECQADARICCFEDEIRQVFANLVSNSLDAIAIGGRLLIRIRTTRRGAFRGVRVTVADTGCGIPANIRQRIFEPFFSTKDATGIGLGLWVSDGILRKHAARWCFRSSTHPGRHGTIFSLFFPYDGVNGAQTSRSAGSSAAEP
jgi:PAS domain S-box-containing protein